MTPLSNRNFLLLIWLLLFTGCAQLGLTPPTTTRDKMAYATTSLDAIYQQIPPAVTSGTLTKEQGTTLLKSADAATDTLAAGKAALSAGNENAALGYLKAAQALIATLQSQLPKPVK